MKDEQWGRREKNGEDEGCDVPLGKEILQRFPKKWSPTPSKKGEIMDPAATGTIVGPLEEEEEDIWFNCE